MSALDPLDRARRKAYRRIIPLVFVSYVIAYIDRSNVALAKLTMMADLGFDNRIFARGFGIFFFGYVLLEWPGALIAERWSARKWVSRIMITWGLIAASTAAVTTVGQFYTARFALGLAEAGFFPAIIVYLRHWFPARDRARTVALFMMGGPIAEMITPPLSAPLLRIGTGDQPPLLGLEGWQWMYMVWGLPAVVMGVVVLFVMTDRPAQARWLDPEEREALERTLATERAARGAATSIGPWRALIHPAALLLAAANFFVVTGHYAVGAFLPTMLSRWYALDVSAVVWPLSLVGLAVLLGQLGVSWSSDRTGERWWHAMVPLFLGSAVLAVIPSTRSSLALTVLAFCVANAAIRSYLAPFYALLGRLLDGAAAASAIGLIQAIGNLGGWAGPELVGWVEKRTGSFEGGLYALAGSVFISGTCIVILRLREGPARHRTAEKS